MKKKDEGNLWFVGHPIDVIYDYEYQGLWQAGEEAAMNILEPGGNIGMIKVKYTGDYDANGLPTRQIGPEDRQIMSMEPDLMGGFNTTVGYKGLDLTVIGAFQVGGKLISAIHSSNGYLNMLTPSCSVLAPQKPIEWSLVTAKATLSPTVSKSDLRVAK